MDSYTHRMPYDCRDKRFTLTHTHTNQTKGLCQIIKWPLFIWVIFDLICKNKTDVFCRYMFQICLSLARLLHYLAHSPLGSLTLLDFRPRQFVLVDGELKVTDLDDASVEDTPCSASSPADCLLEFPARNFTLPCSSGYCQGINEKRNLYNAYR